MYDDPLQVQPPVCVLYIRIICFFSMCVCVCGGGGGTYMYTRLSSTVLYRSNRLSIVLQSVDFVFYLPVHVRDAVGEMKGVGGGGREEEYSGDLVDCLVRYSQKNPVHRQLRRLLGEVLFCFHMHIYGCVCMNICTYIKHNTHP
jgi:hypothetical protein